MAGKRSRSSSSFAAGRSVGWPVQQAALAVRLGVVACSETRNFDKPGRALGLHAAAIQRLGLVSGFSLSSVVAELSPEIIIIIAVLISVGACIIVLLLYKHGFPTRCRRVFGASRRGCVRRIRSKPSQPPAARQPGAVAAHTLVPCPSSSTAFKRT